MTKTFYITHTDDHGERHQLSGAWEAESTQAAIAAMLDESGSDDDGQWLAHEVTVEADVIE
jgi:hypothetical protein